MDTEIIKNALIEIDDDPEGVMHDVELEKYLIDNGFIGDLGNYYFITKKGYDFLNSCFKGGYY